ncbi:MAG: ATP-binding protein [Thiotrichales bacterium]|nr:ATP-binding protein [Thiotrichales bacterium]
MRKFNTEGPVVAADHYCIPPLERVSLAEVLGLVRDNRYFVLHAPRQTGKTSTLLALRDLLNGGTEGSFRCVYVNVEAAQAVREDVERAMRVILGELASRARSIGDEFLYAAWPDILATFGDGAFGEALTRWCEADPRPVVLLIDEIDTLIGDSLISVLRQLRARYDRRPRSFPQSVVLCGVRDVRDYRIRSRSENAVVGGGSAFNVRAESLRIGHFTRADVHALLAQHTEETGQAFTPEALETVWRQTRGQPWLVNALCRKVCFDDEAGRDRSRAITATDIFDAREHLVQSRQVHLDQLADKLQEDRVRRVVGPLLSGADEREFSAHDLEYVRDLGLIARDNPPRIANPIYAEVVPNGEEPGAVETLCRRSKEGDAAAACVDEFLSCLDEQAAMRSTNVDKSFAHAYLAATENPVARVGEGAMQGAWNFDSPVFAELADFLRELASRRQ